MLTLLGDLLNMYTGSSSVCMIPPPRSAVNAYDHIRRLSVQRLRTLQEKKEAQAKSARRDIATLLERGRLGEFSILLMFCI